PRHGDHEEPPQSGGPPSPHSPSAFVRRGVGRPRVRVLLCSDIHGNAAALAAVIDDRADYTLCAGDLIHFGPQPTECIDLIRRCAAVVVRGNHDHGAGFGEDCRAYGPWRALDAATRGVADESLSEAHIRLLQS